MSVQSQIADSLQYYKEAAIYGKRNENYTEGI